MNLYNFHDQPESIHNHDKADKEIPDIFWEKYHDNPKELKAREPTIAKSANYAYHYAQYVLKGPFPKGESAIAKNAYYAYYYAKYILKKRFPKGEPTIATDSYYAKQYNKEFGTKL